MAEFEYTDGTARAAITQFDELGATLGSLLDGVHELAGDSPWSQDKIGSSFAGKFDGDRSKVVENAGGLKNGIQSVSPTLTATADDILAQDGGVAG